MSDQRTFSVEEANALLPTVSESLGLIKEARQVVLAGGKRVRHTAPTNGGGEVGKQYWEALSALRRQIEGLSELGVILRDPENGLIDFPTRMEGREAFLCWKIGEARVGYWHGPESGFAGRRPL